MFLTKLVEEGVIGLASMLFFFSLVVVRMVRDRRRDEWRRWTWFAAVGALTVAIGASQVGPRWHQEQALFVMIILGIYLGSRRNRGVPD
jgi:O-antigen ligase